LLSGNSGGPFTTITSLLGAFSPSDENVANAGQPWLFTGDLLVNIGNSSAAAVVLSDHGGWQAPQRMGTERFRRLRLDIYIDPLRDASFDVIETSSLTEDRGMDLFRAIQSLLHRRDNDTITWGDLVTTACVLLTEPEFIQMGASSGNQMSSQLGSAYYGVSFSGWTDAVA
jgi:hypothetical protein